MADVLKENDDLSLSLTPTEDAKFIRSDECRGARLLLEYLKPETAFKRLEVESTIVLFGSARILSTEEAVKRLTEVTKKLAEDPGNSELRRQVQAASRLSEQSKYYDMARDFARIVTEEGLRRSEGDPLHAIVLTGGGPGIMEAGNRGAYDADGYSASLAIQLPHEQKTNVYSTRELTFSLHYFCMRKMHFMMRARALACFPGGLGTMDELFEALTLVQTGKVQRIPILLFGKEFWTSFMHLEELAERGLISPEDLKLIVYCETAQEGWEAIRSFYSQNGVR